MKSSHFIVIFLSLNIFFGNMAWAMDECGLICDFSTQTINASNTDAIKYISSNDRSKKGHCNTLCAGWMHLNYITNTWPHINISKAHNDITSDTVIYIFNGHKPLTEPPKS